MQLLSQNSLRYIKVFNVLEKNHQSAANFYETARKIRRSKEVLEHYSTLYPFTQEEEQ